MTAQEQPQWKKDFRRRFKEEITERPGDTSFISMEDFIQSILSSMVAGMLESKKAHHVRVSDIISVAEQFGFNINRYNK